MNFSQALDCLKFGQRIERKGWNGKGMYLYIQMSQPPWQNFIVMKTVNDTLVPWLASQTDILAEDWETVE